MQSPALAASPAASPSAFASLSGQNQAALARPSRADELNSTESSFGSVLASRTTAATALTRPSRSTSPGITNPADSARALLAQGRKSGPLTTDVASKLTRPSSPDSDASSSSAALARRASKPAAAQSQDRVTRGASSPEDRAAEHEKDSESKDPAAPASAVPRDASAKPGAQSATAAGTEPGQPARSAASDAPSGTNPDGQRRGDQPNQNPGQNSAGQDDSGRGDSGQPQSNRDQSAGDQPKSDQSGQAPSAQQAQSSAATAADPSAASGAAAGRSATAPPVRAAQVARSIATIGHLNAELLRRSTLSVTSINQVAVPTVAAKLLRQQGGPPTTACVGSTNSQADPAAPSAQASDAQPNSGPLHQPGDSPADGATNTDFTAAANHSSAGANDPDSPSAFRSAVPLDPTLAQLIESAPPAKTVPSPTPAPHASSFQPPVSDQASASAATPAPNSGNGDSPSDNPDAQGQRSRASASPNPVEASTSPVDSSSSPQSASHHSAASQASTSSAQNATLGAQVDRAVASIYRQVEQRPLIAPGPVTMRLRPEALGQLRIKMDLRDSGISLRFEVGTAEAHRQLTEHTSKLADSLATKGVSLQSVAVTIDPSLSRPESADQPAPANTSGASQAPADQQFPFNQSNSGEQSHDGHPNRDPRSHRGGFFDAALLIPRKS